MPKVLLTDKSNYQMKEASVILLATQSSVRRAIVTHLEVYGDKDYGRLMIDLNIKRREMKNHIHILELAQLVTLSLGRVSLNTGRLLQLTQLADNIVNY